MCRNKSCLIIRQSEAANLGIIVEAPISKKKKQELAVAFINDTDFVISRKSCK